jgi:glycosyltransferase involved in cell wall biosynthesis
LVSKGKTVCIVSQYWTPDISGDVTRLKQVIDALKMKDYKIWLITTTPHYPDGAATLTPAEIGDRGVKVFRIPMPHIPHRGFLNRLILYTWFSLLATIPVLALGKKDFIWTFGQRIFSTFSAIPAKYFWNVPLASDATDVWPEALVNTGYARPDSAIFRIGKALSRMAYRRCTAITTITSRMATIIAANNQVPLDRIFVLPYVSHRAHPASPDTTFTVLYFGNIGANYDLRTVVRAAKQLEFSGVHFVIRGNGDLLPELIRELERLGPGNVTLITKPMPQVSLESLVSLASLLVLPMVQQVYPDVSFPGKFVEYLFAGKPIAYIGEGLPSELIKTHELGGVVGYGDVDGLKNLILYLKENPKMLERMGSNGLRLAQEKFSQALLNETLAQFLNYMRGEPSV